MRERGAWRGGGEKKSERGKERNRQRERGEDKYKNRERARWREREKKIDTITRKATVDGRTQNGVRE